MRAEVTHEGIEARVGEPEMVRGDRPTSLMGEITGKQNIHVVYRADGEMVLPADPHLRVSLVFLSRQEGWIVKVNPLFSQSRRLPVTEGYPQIRERATRAQEKGQYCGCGRSKDSEDRLMHHRGPDEHEGGRQPCHTARENEPYLLVAPRNHN